jgi:[acyl-carrier-protein] S-malonyltransferase
VPVSPSAPGSVALVDGRPLPRDSTDARVAALRSGPLHALLPKPDTAEARQLVRWAAQVEMVIALCRSEASRRGLPAGDGPPTRLERRAAVELGSVVTAAWEHSQAVRSVAAAVGGPDPAAGPAPHPGDEGEYLLRHRLEADYATALAVVEAGDPGAVAVMGWSRPGELPPAVAALLVGAEAPVPGRLLGPASSSLGWHVVAVDAQRVRASERPGAAGDGDARRRRRFLRWLVGEQAVRVRVSPGFEHPGDPRQPDNHHRH